MGITTIQLNSDIKEKLDSLKMHQRETYNELISRLITGTSLKTASRESLIATIETLSNPQEMREIREALEEEGGISLEELEKELDL